MNWINVENRPLIFSKLPKEHKKALQNEYSTTAVAKKMSKVLTISALTYLLIGIVSAILGFLTSHFIFFLIPCPAVIFFIVLPSILSQNKFSNWLISEKNIAMK